MAQQRPFTAISVKQTSAVLDNAPVAVCVCAADNKELLYVNKLGQELFFSMPYRPGLTCYQVAGFEQPCPFCTADKMGWTDFVSRDFCHPATNRIYRLSGKLIDWDGRHAHIEYILDITEVQEKEERTRALSRELQETFSSMPCGLCVYRIEDSRIVPIFHNPAFYEIMGYSEEHIHMIEQNTDYLGVHPEDLDTLQQKIQGALNENGNLLHTYRVWNDKEMEYHWIHLEGSMKLRQDGTKLFYGVYTDVTGQQRLEQYFETLVKNLPGGAIVMCAKPDGSIKLEFISEGFTKMTKMTPAEIWVLYGNDVMAGVHPEDVEQVKQRLAEFLASGADHCDIVYRIRKGEQGYLWVRNTISNIPTGDGESRIYANYHDITREREEQEKLRRQYNELLIQHYRLSGPDVLLLGHCNVSRNLILEINEQMNFGLLVNFGTKREEFFTGVAGFVVDEKEQKDFLNTYLNAPSAAAFERGETELVRKYFIRLPGEKRGRYAQFVVNLVKEPDTGDIVGILTVTDITKSTINDKIMHQLTISTYDFVIDVDLEKDSFQILEKNTGSDFIPEGNSYSGQMELMLQTAIVPKDRKRYAEALDPSEMRRRLALTGSYTFFFSVIDEHGDVRTKNMTVSAVDLRIGRVCLVRTDITDSVREQQGLLSVVAYTFEMLAFIKTDTRRITVHTRQSILENLPPFTLDKYDEAAVRDLAESYGQAGEQSETEKQFRLETMLDRLSERPAGYDFVAPYSSESGLRYKQINILWGDSLHKTVCLVRADVTDMLAAEHRSKEALKEALIEAEKASLAKSNFLSSMSHDIRTPMNAIIGMTSLALTRLYEPERMEDCLEKISYSSKHLLSLINDILDMSKIERAKIALKREKLSLPEIMEQLSAMMAPQAEEAGIRFITDIKDIRHPYFYGDFLRINQVLINILGNAVKFTSAGGSVEFWVEELTNIVADGRVRYCFTIRDTGIGMPEEFLEHVFEPFTRSSKAAYVEGTGLGLSITKGLVDLMEGEISVESKLDEGTIFRVTLEYEISDGAAPAAPVPMGIAKQLGEGAIDGCHFLVAEDNAINSEILCELLHMYGASSAVCTDGSQAVEAFRAAEPGTFDAILMDIQMPVMNGYEAARAIRSLRRGDAATIPIIAMTANAFAEDIQSAFDAGMNAHVAKPIDVPTLLAVLGSALRG